MCRLHRDDWTRLVTMIDLESLEELQSTQMFGYRWSDQGKPSKSEKTVHSFRKVSGIQGMSCWQRFICNFRKSAPSIVVKPCSTKEEYLHRLYNTWWQSLIYPKKQSCCWKLYRFHWSYLRGTLPSAEDIRHRTGIFWCGLEALRISR